MYSASLKSDGAIVGVVASSSSQINHYNGEEAFENTQANESLVYQELNERNECVEEIAVAHLNDETGDLNWSKATDKSYINNRTIAMSQMASMLKDVDRNKVYEQAIHAIIQHFIVNTGIKQLTAAVHIHHDFIITKWIQ